MASALVLPTSRKQEHLEAGKRKLEEFRKKKAAERAKKSVSASQPHASDVSLSDKYHLGTDRVRITDLDGAGTSDGPDKAVVEPPIVLYNDDSQALKLAQQSQQGSLNDKHAKTTSLPNDLNLFFTDPTQTYSDGQETLESAGSVGVSNSQETKDAYNDFVTYSSGQSRLPHGSMSNQFFSLSPQASQDYDSNVLKSSFQGMEALQAKGSDGFPTVSTIVNPGPLHDFVNNISPQNSVSTSLQSMPSNGHSFHFSFEATNKFAPGKSRKSFFDSLNVPRPSSGVLFQHTEPEKESFVSNSSPFNSMDVPGSSAAQKPSMEKETMGPFLRIGTPNTSSEFDYLGNPSVSVSNGGDMLRLGSNEDSMDKQHGFYSTKQNEDFAALEQYIEDLTREKFSLQRSLEASRTLAESLAAENSSLTDSYNGQRSVVNQLKSEMEKLQGEIKAQLVELESFRNEYANVHLECTAADERAKILASEVIGLEDKALRLRSNELKLERQLENSQSEMSSYKKKMSNLEKERQDLQSTIEALQEEKKVLQSKIRKASVSGKSVDFKKAATSRKDASTSTEDLANADTTLDNSNQEMPDDASLPRIDASSAPLQPKSGQLALEVLAINIHPDQMRMIHNINTLISELTLEKEELMQALSSESAQNSKLKDLNNELSRKLEVQTQRLELLTAQNMANENVSSRQPDSVITHDSTAYADEGDEVVERVLGWIMKLFPGGPSRRRRTSKLL